MQKKYTLLDANINKHAGNPDIYAYGLKIIDLIKNANDNKHKTKLIIKKIIIVISKMIFKGVIVISANNTCFT